MACMRANTECHLQVATGGKENDLKLWDGIKPEKPTFQAKNVSLNCYLLFHCNDCSIRVFVLHTEITLL